LAPILPSSTDKQRDREIIIATIVFGKGIEPSGMELENVHFEEICPVCAYERARYRIWESAQSGAINLHGSISCPACGYKSIDDEEQ
jgi:hypothetical protein